MPILLSSDFPPSNGGIQRYVHRLAEQLALAGQPVTVVAPAHPGDAAFDTSCPFTVVRYAVGAGRIKDLRAMRAAYRCAVRVSSDRWTIASSWFPTGLVAATAGGTRKRSLAILAHGTEIAPNSNPLRRFLLRAVLGAADRVIANSAFTAALVAETGFRKHVDVVPCGVDVVNRQRNPAATPTILSVGRLVERKGFDRLIEAVAQLAEYYPDLVLEIVGTGPYLAALHEIAEAKDVVQRIRFLGALTDDELTAAYARAWCFAMPVRRVRDDVEGFGIVYLEAGMAGLAAVGGVDSGASDAIVDGETGILVDGGDTAAVVTAIDSLLRDPIAAERIGAAARERALAEFSWSANAARIHALLELQTLPRIKVAFLDQTGDTIGGAQESLLLLLKHLSSSIDATVFFFNDGILAQRVRDLGLNVRIVRMPATVTQSTRERPNPRAILDMIPVVWRLSRELAPFDVVHINTIKAHVVGLVSARLANVPSVVHLRDILEGRSRVLMQTAYRAARRRIAISQAVSRAYAVEPTAVVMNPLDLTLYEHLPTRKEARAALGVPEDRPLVAIIGRINRWKGHDRFLEIAAMVAASSRAHFAIIGEARFRDLDFVGELERAVVRLGLQDRVSFVPWQTDPLLAYAAMDVHCNCSDAEPFGRTIIEAAAAGVPTVCFDTGGAAEAIERGVTGFAVPHTDSEAFARAILSYLNDAERLTNARAAARAWSRRFSVAAHVREVITVLRAAAGPKKLRRSK